MSWAEFLCGPLEVEDVDLANRIVGEPLTLLGDDARLTARLFNLARRRGSLVDCMIAATAVRAGAALATRNPADFPSAPVGELENRGRLRVGKGSTAEGSRVMLAGCGHSPHAVNFYTETE